MNLPVIGGAFLGALLSNLASPPAASGNATIRDGGTAGAKSCTRYATRTKGRAGLPRRLKTADG
jgi:hypothetical protein